MEEEDGDELVPGVEVVRWDGGDCVVDGSIGDEGWGFNCVPAVDSEFPRESSTGLLLFSSSVVIEICGKSIVAE